MDGQDLQDFVLRLRVDLVHPVDPCLIDRELFESGKEKAQGQKSLTLANPRGARL